MTLSLIISAKDDGRAFASTRAPTKLLSVGVLHHLQWIPHVAGEYFLLERLELFPVGTVLALAPGGSALPGL